MALPEGFHLAMAALHPLLHATKEGVVQRTHAIKEHQKSRKQSGSRPLLVASCAVYRSESLEEEILLVTVFNAGEAGAHNVQGSIAFHKDSFGQPKLPSSRFADCITVPRDAVSHCGVKVSVDPDKNGWYIASIFENKELRRSELRVFDIPVTLKRTGVTPIGCHVECREGAIFGGPLWVEVPGKT